MQQVNIMMNLFGFAIVFFVLVTIFFTVNSTSKTKKPFLHLCFFVLVRNMADALAWRFERETSTFAYVINFICIILLTLSTFLMIGTFIVCVYRFISKPCEKSKLAMKISAIVCTISFFLILLNIPFDFLYGVTRSTNTYYRGNFYWILFVLMVIMVIMCIAVIIFEHLSLRRGDLVAFLTYIGMFILAIVILAINSKISANALFMAIAIVLLALRIQLTQYEKTNAEKIVATIEASSLSKAYTGVCRYDRKSNVFLVRTANEKYRDYYSDGVLNIEKFIDEIVSSEYRKEVGKYLSSEWLDALFETDESKVIESEYLEEKDAAWRRMIMIYRSDKMGKELFLLFHDITQEKQSQFDSLEQTRRMINASKDMYCDFMEWYIEQNKVIRLMFDDNGIVEVPVMGEFIKAFKRFRDNNVLPEDLETFSSLSPQKLICLPMGQTITCSYRLRENNEFRYILNPEKKKNVTGNIAEYRWHTTVARKTKAHNGEEIITFLTQDVEASVKERLALKTISEHDKLTELYNRTKYNVMLESDYAHLSSCGVLFFDVNYLKHVNDEHGHEAGDMLLKTAADSLKFISNERIHAYRYGGDEMVVIVCNGSFDEMEDLISKWRDNLAVLNQNTTIKCSMAVGKAWSNCNVNLTNLIMVADDRMYIDKKRIKEGKTA